MHPSRPCQPTGHPRPHPPQPAMDLRRTRVRRLAGAGLAVWVLWLAAAAPAARADAKVEINGVVDQQTSLATLSGVPGAGSLAGSADRRDAGLQVQVGGGVPGVFTCCRVGAAATLESSYTVSGLGTGEVVTFTWEASGTLGWSTENANVGQAFGASIFNKVGATYIHGVGWSQSFVDGPVFMGDFAGSVTAPIQDTGHAGPPGVFGESVPAAHWGGNGTVQFQTHWTLADGWSGTLSLSASAGLVGDAQTALSLRLVSLTVAQPTGPAALLLDNGVSLPISAVPEPGGAWLLLAGLGVVVAAGRRRRR